MLIICNQNSEGKISSLQLFKCTGIPKILYERKNCVRRVYNSGHKVEGNLKRGLRVLIVLIFPVERLYMRQSNRKSQMNLDAIEFDVLLGSR